jgi:hypothetical protein
VRDESLCWDAWSIVVATVPTRVLCVPRAGRMHGWCVTETRTGRWIGGCRHNLLHCAITAALLCRHEARRILVGLVEGRLETVRTALLVRMQSGCSRALHRLHADLSAWEGMGQVWWP